MVMIFKTKKKIWIDNILGEITNFREMCKNVAKFSLIVKLSIYTVCMELID